jgi:hypothetical protein
VSDPTPPHGINPAVVYTLASATAALGPAKECLPREVRLGRLQARKRAGRYFILGRWLLDWLATGQPHPRWRAAERPRPAAAANGKAREGKLIDKDGV